MGIIDRVVAAFGYIKAGEAQAVLGGEIPFGYSGDYNWREDGSSAWTEERLKRYAMQSSWVFSNVDLIASAFSVAEVQVYEKKGEELEAKVDHELERIFEAPSSIEFIDASFLWKFSMTWGLLHGEFYWLLNTDRTKVLREIIPIPADRIWPVPDAKNYIAGFMYQPLSGGKAQPIPKDNVLYWRRPGRNFHRGQSLFEPLNRPLETDVAASQWNVDTFRKGLSLQTVLGLPETLSNALFEQAKADIERAMSEEQRRFLITRSGQVTAQTVGVTHKDAEFLSMRDLTRREIDRLFGIPEGYWSEKATRANAEAAHIGLYRHAIQPLRVSVQRAITAQILRRYYGDNLRAKFKDDVPPDQATWDAKSLDEVRADLGLPPWHTKDQGKTLFPLAKAGKWEGQEQAAPGAPGAGPAMPGPAEGGNDKPPRPGKDGGEGDQTPPEAKQPQAATDKPAPEAKQPAGDDKPEGKAYTMLDLVDAPAVEPSHELKADLRRWRSIARRQLKAGSRPAQYHFHSHHIPAWMQADIMVALTEAHSEDEVKAIFDNVLEAKAVTFIPRGSADPLPPLGEALPLGEPGREAEDEAAMLAAIAAWNRTMPEVAGLLEARHPGLVGVPALGMAEFAKAYTLVDEELKGGPGSGNWGHAGRPGKRGGSMERGQAMSRTSGKDWQARYEARTGRAAPGDKSAAPNPAQAALTAHKAALDKRNASLAKAMELVTPMTQARAEVNRRQSAAYHSQRRAAGASLRDIANERDEAIKAFNTLRDDYNNIYKKAVNDYIAETDSIHPALMAHYRQQAGEVRAKLLAAPADAVEQAHQQLEEITLKNNQLVAKINKMPDSDPQRAQAMATYMTYTEQIGELARQVSEGNRVKPLAAGLAVENKAQPTVDIVAKPSKAVRDTWGKGVADFSELVSDAAMPLGSAVSVFGNKSGRANAAPGVMNLDKNDGVATVVHELGHVLEAANPRVGRMAREFLKERTAGDKSRSLATLTGNPGYSRDEWAKPDKFIYPYMGKEYRTKDTEIVSMGLEMMRTEPRRLAREDPDYFDFIYSLMRAG